jgi:Co/Zn/Cd efflux system component
VGDAMILGSSLFVMTASQGAKARLALVKCVIWLVFGLLTFYHVGQNIITGQVPNHLPIIILGAIALIGNIISTLLLQAYREKDVNLKSAYICCRNDALGNLLIIIAGLLIMATGTNWPDIIVGMFIGLLVIYSAAKISKESLIILQKRSTNIHL